MKHYLLMLKLLLLTNLAMWAVVILLITSSTATAGPYIQAGIGNNAFGQEYWEGSDELGGSYGFGYRWRPTENWGLDLGYKHFSQVFRGKPFNDEYESHLDTVYLDLSYEWH